MTASIPDRLHALDAARAFALLLGVELHATMSFFLPIPAQDNSPSTTLAVTFYVIHSFRMSLFFLIAGFFAHMAFHRIGARAFVKDRARRIVVPMTVGWVLLAPLTIAILVWGMARTVADVPAARLDATAAASQGFPLTHLWFLYYLCIFYVLALGLRAAVVDLVDRGGALRARIDATLRVGLISYLAPLVLAAPSFAVLYLDPGWPLWFGIPTPDIGLLPKLPALVGFGTAFALGWLLHRQVTLLDIWRAQWAVNLAIAAGLSALCIGLIGATPAADASTIAGPPWRRLVYAAGYTLSIWYWSFGLIGAALRFCSGASARWRYLADASYWCYLAHLPIVFALQVLMMELPLHWTLKFPLIIAITLALLFASYHYLVRPTFIGEILNGRKYPRRTSADDSRSRVILAPRAPALGAPPADANHAPVAQLIGVSKRYGQTLALDDFSFEVRAGELLALLGPNGAGKTTAIGLWLGTLEADQGDVRIFGGSPFDANSRLGVGVMMQDVNLTPMLSAREHIALTASCYRNPLTVDATVALTGIGAFARQRYGQLSGGQKRQVQFALAVCGQPQLLFLDEPTVGLDVQARAAMWQTIRTLRDTGCAIVLTTHYLEEAEALADRVAVIAKGKLIAEGSVDEMRALVSRKRIRCTSATAIEQIRRWPGVVDVVRETRHVQVTAIDAEAVVRRLLDADPDLGQLEVAQASLAEAFTALTKEAA